MKRLVILGGGGISIIAATIADRMADVEVWGYLNDRVLPGELVGKKKKHVVLGKIEEVGRFLKEKDVFFFIAFAGFTDPSKSLTQIHSLDIPQDRYINLIDPMTSIAYDYSDIGFDVMVAPFAQIGPEVNISNHCVLLGNAFVGHGSNIEEFSHIASNAVVGANLTVGKGSHIGTNSVIRERANIGEFSIVGSGAVVLNSIPANSIVVGNPAKILKMREPVNEE